MQPLQIIYEDNHLLVVNKPSGVATMGAESGPTLHSLAAEYLRRTYNKPGRAFVGIVSRLDAMTSGVIVLARTSKAASRLAPQFGGAAGGGNNGGRATKIYLAAVAGRLPKPDGALDNHLRKDDAARRMRVVGADQQDARRAILDYQRLGETDDATLVAVQLQSGRKHQIRVQFAAAGHPILGDRKYGSSDAFPAGIALHSWQLQLTHPTKRDRRWFSAPLPPSWNGMMSSLPDTSRLWADVVNHFQLDLSGSTSG